MDERQCEIIKLRCGLFDGKYWSLNKIANKFNLSTERVRQLEKKALLKLRHPYRIQLMKDYTDETFEKDTHEELVDNFKSLIRQDIVNNVVLQSFKYIENVKIQDLNIVIKPKFTQQEQYIKNVLVYHKIMTCKDLLNYIQLKGDLQELELNNASYRALIYAMCELIDIKNAENNSKKIFEEFIDHKTESKNIAYEQQIKNRQEKERLETEQREKRLNNIIAHPENVLVEDIGLNSTILAGLERLNIKTVADIIEHYSKNQGTIRRISCLGQKKDWIIVKKLKQLGINLIPNEATKKEVSINHPEQFKVENMDLGLRSYNCLKRAKINTLKELLDFYYSHDNSLLSIKNLGNVCEQEILIKLSQMGIDIFSKTNNL